MDVHRWSSDPWAPGLKFLGPCTVESHTLWPPWMSKMSTVSGEIMENLATPPTNPNYNMTLYHIFSYLKSFATKSELSVWAHVRTYSIKYIKFQYHTRKYSENPWVQFVNPKFLTCSSNLHHPCISMYGRSRSI